MKKKTAYLVSFKQGMVEVRKSDAEMDENGMQDSVEFLENYDPNTQLDSIIKRPSIDYNQLFNTTVLPHNDAIDIDLSSLGYTKQDSVVLGAKNFVVSEPMQANGLVMFIQKADVANPITATVSDCRELKTAVMSYLPHYDESSGLLSVSWKCTPTSFVAGIKGFYDVHGYLTDFATYGETVLFTTLSPETDTGLNTNPAIADETPRTRYPIYVYKFINFTDYYRDGNALMNGITGYEAATVEANKKLYNRWIIKTPSQAIFNMNVGAYTTVGNTPVKLNADGSVGTGNLTDDVCVVVFERDAQEIKYEGEEGNPIEVDDILSPTNDSYGDWLFMATHARKAAPSSVTFVNPFINLPTTPVGRHTKYYDTMETLDLPNLYSFAKSKGIAYNNTTPPSNFFTAEDIGFNTHPVGSVKYLRDYADGSVCLGIHTTSFFFQQSDSMYNYTHYGIWLDNTKEKVKDTTTGEVIEKDMIALGYNFASAWSKFEGPPSAYPVLRRYQNYRMIEKLIDYINLETPRFWVYSEKIKFLLVANVNGIKIPLKEFDYVVRANNLDEYTGALKASRDANPGYYATYQSYPGPAEVNNMAGSKEMSSYSLLSTKYKTENTTALNPLGTRTNLYSDVQYQLWASILPSSVDNSNIPFRGNGDNVEALSGNPYKDAATDTLYIYPYEHHLQRMTRESIITNGTTNAIKKVVRIGKLVCATIAIRKAMITGLIENGCTEISLYAVQPDDSQHIIKSLGLNSTTEPDGIVYCKPKSITQDYDYSKYALVKHFSLVGKNETIIDYKSIKRQRLKTNAWKDYTAGSTEYAMAVPVQEGTDDPYTTVPPFDNIGDSDWTKAKTWTPDFYLWDYPTDEPLILNYSGRIWDGVGARCCAVVKGRTFIGGCYDEKGIEEQAIVRYSIVQGGVISPDLFAEEDILRVGHEPITALVEFREQLWVFNRNKNYRIQMRDIVNISSWEFLEAVVQGAHHPKHIAVTPYGVVYANEAGVWLSDGADPQNIAVPILGTYTYVASFESITGSRLNHFAEAGNMVIPNINVDANQHISGNGDKEINMYMECAYDAVNDEIQILAPMFNSSERGEAVHDIQAKLVFSFRFRNWRVETYSLPDYE